MIAILKWAEHTSIYFEIFNYLCSFRGSDGNENKPQQFNLEAEQFLDSGAALGENLGLQIRFRVTSQRALPCYMGWFGPSHWQRYYDAAFVTHSSLYLKGIPYSAEKHYYGCN